MKSSSPTSYKARRIAGVLQTVAILSFAASILMVIGLKTLPWPLLFLPIPLLLLHALFDILADIAAELESLKHASNNATKLAPISHDSNF